MLLTSFVVEKLFGIYSYNIKFDQIHEPYLLTGPNGFGKTTILTIIDNIARKNLFYFYQLPFEKIILDFDATQQILIRSERIEDQDIELDGDRRILTDRQILFEWYQDQKLISKFLLNKKLLAKANRNIGYYNGRLVVHYDLMSDDYMDFISNNSRIYDIIAKEQEQEQFLMLLNSISTNYIKAQRLFTEKTNEKVISSFDMVVDKLKKKLEDQLFQYLRTSQKKDSTFIDTLFDSDIKEYNKEEYENEVLSLESKIEELRSFELISSIKIRTFNPEYAKILTAYIKELNEKLNIYTEILSELRLFASLLKEKEFANKKIRFSPTYGLRVETSNGEFLDKNKLSSGEQNQIIMLYYLIFEVSDGTILLIDEPEISLHVAWQQKFLDDLTKILRLNKIQIIIATHSPQIIGGRWNECIDLYENSNRK